jgi:hypothetical protein
MHLTNEELLWWCEIGIAVRKAAGGARSAAHIGGVLQRGTLHSASTQPPSCQLAARSSQPCRYPTGRTLAYHGCSPRVRHPPVFTCRTTAIAQSITRNLDGDAPRNAARRRARPQPQPARHHRPLSAVARRWRRARAVVPVHSQGSHGATEPPTPKRRSCSSQAMRGVRPYRRHKHRRVGGRHDCSAVRLGLTKRTDSSPSCSAGWRWRWTRASQHTAS